MIPIIIDLIFLAVILLTIYIAYKKGFLYAVITLVGWIVTIIFSMFLSHYISDLIYTNFIDQSVVDAINKAIPDTLKGSEGAVNVTGLLSSLPKLFVNPAIAYYGGKEELLAHLQTAITSSTSSISNTISVNIVKPIFCSVLQLILFFVVSSILFIVIRFLANTFVKVRNIPIIGTVNSILGGVVGIAKAAIFCVMISVVAMLFISFTSNNFLYFNNNVIQSSYIFKYVYNFVVDVFNYLL